LATDFGSNCDQLAVGENKNPAKTETLKSAFFSRLSASRSIRYEKDASEMRRSAGTKRIKNVPVKL
jgi:hypothetical protein